MPARYARILNPIFVDQIRNTRLSELIASTSVAGSDDKQAIDWQIRENSQLMAYHGTTRLLVIRHDVNDGRFAVSAAPAYSEAAGYVDLMRWHTSDEIEPMVNLINDYLKSAVGLAHSRYYRNGAEGYWQNRICERFGRGYRTGDPWCVIDREAVIGFDSQSEKDAIFLPLRAQYQAVKDNLQQSDPATWGAGGAALGHECDLLALSPDGQLLCIEVKHGTSASGIYWGGLQAAAYRDLFAASLDRIGSGIRALVSQKVALRLLPEDALAMIPDSGFRGVASMLVISEPNQRSTCWQRLADVFAHCSASACQVVEISETDGQTQMLVR
jgi:hypothetical protein